jgi:hypothetical protein
VSEVGCALLVGPRKSPITLSRREKFLKAAWNKILFKSEISINSQIRWQSLTTELAKHPLHVFWPRIARGKGRALDRN